MRLHALLMDAQRGHTVYMDLWPKCKALLIAGHRLEVTVKTENRTDEQNRKFHAICSDLERSRLPWFNAPRTAAEWKVLLVSGHAIATKEGANILPGLEGEMVNIRESTALMSKARGSSLIEYSLAFCAEHGVKTLEEAT